MCRPLLLLLVALIFFCVFSWHFQLLELILSPHILFTGSPGDDSITIIQEPLTDTTNQNTNNIKCKIKIASFAFESLINGDSGMVQQVNKRSRSDALTPRKSSDEKPRILNFLNKIEPDSFELQMTHGTDIDKPWSCNNCSRQYKWKNSLLQHLRNECGIPPKYFCERNCGYKTNVNSNLKRHSASCKLPIVAD